MRKEYEHESKPLRLAVGVDSFLIPGDKSPEVPKVFIQVWDTTKESMPCNEGEDGFSNILLTEADVDEARVIDIIKEYNFDVPPRDLFEVFD